VVHEIARLEALELGNQVAGQSGSQVITVPDNPMTRKTDDRPLKVAKIPQ